MHCFKKEPRNDRIEGILKYCPKEFCPGLWVDYHNLVPVHVCSRNSRDFEDSCHVINSHSCFIVRNLCHVYTLPSIMSFKAKPLKFCFNKYVF